MRKRILVYTSVLATILGAILLAEKPQTSLAQEIPPNRKPACTIFCGDGSFNSIELGQPPACFGGPLPAGGAGNYYNGLSREGRSALCDSLESPGRTDSSCPAFKTLSAACDRDKKRPPQPDEKKPDCPDPAVSSGYFTRSPFGPETPADIAPSCESCPGGTWKLNIGEISFHPTERQEEMVSREWLLPCTFLFLVIQRPEACGAVKVIPQCVYTYEAIWTCTASGAVRKTTTTKVEDGHCIPRG